MCVSTDYCRALICDSSANQKISDDAFDLFYFLIEKRLQNGYPAIADSTALKPIYRHRLYNIAQRYNFRIVVIFFDIPLKICAKNDEQRMRSVGFEVIERQFIYVAKARQQLEAETYHQLLVFKTQEQIHNTRMRWTLPAVEVVDSPPIDIIGDVHGCARTLKSLLAKLGYRQHQQKHCYYHPHQRVAVFLGDIMDYGVENLTVLRIIYQMWKWQSAYYLPGNHCNKLFRYLNGRKIVVNHGLDKTIAEFDALSCRERQIWVHRFCQLYAQAPPYLIFDNGNLLTTHAGIIPEFIGRKDRKTWTCCLHGAENFRSDWIRHHHAPPMVVYGHTPTDTICWHNYTLNVDAGAVFGGKLAALRYPEKEIVSQVSQEHKPV